MGLDIHVFKPINVKDRTEHLDELKDKYTEHVIEDNSYDMFKPFFYEVTNEYYDLKTAIEDLGYNEEDLLCVSSEFGENIEYVYLNTKHKLFDAYNYLDDVYHIDCDSLDSLKNTTEFQKFDKEYKQILLDSGWVEKYDFQIGEKTNFNFNESRRFCYNSIKISIVNPPLIKQIDTCILLEEVGYQRKGANKKFYEENIWDSGGNITDSKTLNEHWEKYFSYSTPESKGGFGSGVEFDLSDEHMKNQFKENIIDKFVEGETFVSYS